MSTPQNLRWSCYIFKIFYNKVSITLQLVGDEFEILFAKHYKIQKLDNVWSTNQVRIKNDLTKHYYYGGGFTTKMFYGWILAKL